MLTAYAKTPACAICGSHTWSKRGTSLVTREWIYEPDGEFELDQEEEEDLGETEWTCADCNEAPGSAAVDALEML